MGGGNSSSQAGSRNSLVRRVRHDPRSQENCSRPRLPSSASLRAARTPRSRSPSAAGPSTILSTLHAQGTPDASRRTFLRLLSSSGSQSRPRCHMPAPTPTTKRTVSRRPAVRWLGDGPAVSRAARAPVRPPLPGTSGAKSRLGRRDTGSGSGAGSGGACDGPGWLAGGGGDTGGSTGALYSGWRSGGTDKSGRSPSCAPASRKFGPRCRFEAIVRDSRGASCCDSGRAKSRNAIDTVRKTLQSGSGTPEALLFLSTLQNLRKAYHWQWLDSIAAMATRSSAGHACHVHA